ncbi:IclR family transcriptional regulator [Kocuria sp. JC486]|uniref:IclR family transcriptional regulator n=1 Tax=Kocuria sp. JC486 TaxID=1970736 RepID=UPI001421DB0D|nr:IclR family transcriptional regulator [Kocuria sp. JC486]NHU84306.1 IclR family transcriptional regulator [Kocuria sp. JC486]
MARTQNGESVLTRAVRLIEAFEPGEEWLSVSVLARRSGLHVATASRLISELTTHGWLERNSDRSVRLGLRLWEAAARASSTLSLREAAMPPLEALQAQVRQHTQLGVLDGEEVLFLERLSAPDAVVNFTRIAGRLSLHASSSGLVLLAHAPPAFQESVISSHRERFTTDTPVQESHLREILANIRRRGSVYCPGYLHPEAAGIAAPVFQDDTVRAAVSVVLPRSERAQQWEPAVRMAASLISRRLSAPPNGVINQ